MVSSQTFELKPRIIQAGAGTGKTTCLTKEVFRILHGFKNFYDRYPSLAICTFTRKATQELKQKLYKEAIQQQDRELLAHISSPSIHISTIHGILTLFLRNHGYKYDCDFSNFEPNNLKMEETIFNRVAADLLFGKHFSFLEKVTFPILKQALKFYTRSRLMNPNIQFFSENELKELEEKDQILLENEKKSLHLEQQKIVEFFKKSRKEPECFYAELFSQFFQDFKPLAEEFFIEFLKQKKQNGVTTMEDLELWSLDLLNQHPETGKLFATEWDYWFIDEYQDTSWVQEQIFQKITGFKNVFCVGDPQQSIYLFREADPEVFKRRIKNCPNPAEKLEMNYRSQSSLIYFFNDFFPKEKGFIPLTPSKTKSVPADKSTPSIYFIYYDANTPLQEENDKTYFKEAVYFQIQRLLKKGNSFGNITVLGMKNEHLYQLARFLRQKGLPVRTHSSHGLTENRLILDALFALKFLINPHDDENLLALCRTPYFRISDEELTKWCQEWRKLQESQFYERNGSYPNKDISSRENNKMKIHSSVEKNNNTEKSKSLSVLNRDKFHLIRERKKTFPLSFWNFLQEQKIHQEIIQILETYSNLTEEQGFIFTFEQILLERGLMDLTKFQDSSGVSESHLWNLLAYMHDSQRTGKHPLELFYSLMEGGENEVSLQETLTEEDSDFIQLMTVHSSKGLQFKNVIVFDLTKKVPFNSSKEECIFDKQKGLMAFSIPLTGRDQKSVKCYAQKKYAENKKHQEIEEKDRLLYVALTRAEDTVTLMVPSSTPPAHTWFQRFDFFRELENTPWAEKQKEAIVGTDKKKKPPSSILDFSVKTGLHTRDKYCFLVEHNPMEEMASQKESPPPPLLHPFKTTQDKSPCQKTAGDFVQDMIPSDQRTDFILERKKNIFFKTDQGRYLHDCLKLLSMQSLDILQKKISQRNFPKEEQKEFLSALRWVDGLKKPNMNHFLKTGFAEWPFQWKTNTVTLQGRIDLWGWKEDVLWVFDYKSTMKTSSAVDYQLAFYSYVLEQIYRPKQIQMCALYPFAQKTECLSYSEEHREQVSHWISRQV